MIQNNLERVEQPQSLALETAWQRYTQLASNASTVNNKYVRLRGWAIALSVMITLLAILSTQAEGVLVTFPATEVIRICLILIPITCFVILVFANKLQQGQYWQVLSTGAEEIKKEIYLYRTLLQGQATRHQWLSERVATIQHQVNERVGGNLVLKPYAGNLPPEDSPEAQNNDPGLTDLLADDYLHYRLDAQLKSCSQALTNLYATRTRLQLGIFALAGLSAFLPALATNLSIWVALTASLGTALMLWLEVGRVDSRVSNYNQLILSLNLIHDHWQSLSLQERTGDEFFKLVIATEKVLWSQHNQYISQMHRAVAQLQHPISDLLTQVISKPAPIAIHQALLPTKPTVKEALSVEAEVLPKESAVEDVVQKATKEPQKTTKKGLPHAFVVMPFGRKKGPDGRWIDFNSIYQQLIKPALEEAGFESFRADEEAVSGDILSDMFQELLLADLVLTDLSIDNANVYYELGVSHALRKRGLVHIQCGRAYMPYDIFNVRTIPYQCDENGRPDPKHLEKDKQAIIKVARSTWESDENRIHSPIFNLLTGLNEPDRKALRTPLATGYWQEHKQWKERVEIAKRQKRIGDVLLLTEEVSNPLIKEEALAEAGRALRELGNHALALKEYRQGLKLNSKNSDFRLQEAFHLNRLKQSDEAIVKLEWLLQDEPTNIEAICNLAHIYKEKWKDEWVYIADEQERLKAAYEAAHLLTKAIETYLKAYRLNQNNYYPGINALTLSAALDHLAQEVSTDSDPEEEALRKELPPLKGAVQFSLESAANTDPNDFWVFASLGDLAVCVAQDPKQVTRAYKKALTLVGNRKFDLKGVLAQLQLLEALRFRPDYVQAGINVLQAELNRFEGQGETVVSNIAQEPLQVFMFCGHMIDAPGRAQPRFPAAMESEARQKIEAVLRKLKPSANCLAIAPGAACGADILFLEACLQHNMKVEVFLPFYQAEFIRESVSFAGDEWVSRFYAIQNHPNVTINIQPERLGKVPEGDNPFARNNRWALYSTLMYGIEKVRLVVLWNGKEGDAGGTGDMVQEVRRLGGVVEHIDTTKFDYWQTQDNIMEPIFQKLLDSSDTAQRDAKASSRVL